MRINHLTSFLRGIGLLFLLSTSALNPAPLLADEEGDEKLMVLSFLDLRNRTVEKADVLVEPGYSLSPHAGVPKDRIQINPGSVIEMEELPAERLVQLFRGAGDKRILICIVRVRYYSVAGSENMWEPRYQIHQEPVIVPDGKGWRPLGTVAGQAGGLTFTQSTLPNAEGFFRNLEFSVGIGSTFLDSWLVN